MSVQVNTYLVIGVKLPYDDKWTGEDNYEKFEDYHDSAYEGIHHHNGLCMLSDGMSGEYVIIGKVLQKSGSHGGLRGVTDLDEIDSNGCDRIYVGSLLKAQFDIDKPATIMIVSHYR